MTDPNPKRCQWTGGTCLTCLACLTFLPEIVNCSYMDTFCEKYYFHVTMSIFKKLFFLQKFGVNCLKNKVSYTIFFFRFRVKFLMVCIGTDSNN